jgi:hypothetical protein
VNGVRIKNEIDLDEPQDLTAEDKDQGERQPIANIYFKFQHKDMYKRLIPHHYQHEVIINFKNLVSS